MLYELPSAEEARRGGEGWWWKRVQGVPMEGAARRWASSLRCQPAEGRSQLGSMPPIVRLSHGILKEQN